MKKIIHTEKAPKAIGPYSQAVLINDLIFTSGQLALDPNTMELVSGDIKIQAKKALENLKFVLEKAGSNMNSIVKTTCFLKNMTDFIEFNKVYNEFFEDGNYPARSCFEVSRLPKDALIEIEAIAYKII